MRSLPFVLFLLAILAGCATTYPSGVAEIVDKDFDELFSEHDGLTLTGCAAFFPRERAVDCLSRWQERSLEERFSYLRLNGSPLVRGFWRSVTLAASADVLKESRILGDNLTVDDIRSHLVELSHQPITTLCGKEATRGEQDVCMFVLGEVATEEEVNVALFEIARLEQRPPVLRQPLPRLQPLFPPHRPRFRLPQ